MRRHGWGGDLPLDDDDARRRIVDAARSVVRATGAAPTVAEVAAELSVTRPTIYRYFPSAEALLLAAASDGIVGFLDDISERVHAFDDAAHVVVEGIAFTYEEIERRTELALLLSLARASGANELTSRAAVELGRSVLEITAVDWPAAGYESADGLDDLAQFMLRILQSLVLDSGQPTPLRGDYLRTYLRRWVAPAVVGGPLASHVAHPTVRSTLGT